MALRPQALRQPTPRRQATPRRQPMEMALLEDMPAEPTVALLVKLIVAVLALLLRCMPVIRPSPLALVRRPMQLLLHHMPQTLPSRMNGTPLPARIDAAICALPTSTPCAVMLAPNPKSPAPLRGFFFVGRNSHFDATWRAAAFSAGGDGGRRSPEHPARVLRFALWLAAYVVLGLLLAMFVQSFANWLLS